MIINVTKNCQKSQLTQKIVRLAIFRNIQKIAIFAVACKPKHKWRVVGSSLVCTQASSSPTCFQNSFGDPCGWFSSEWFSNMQNRTKLLDLCSCICLSLMCDLNITNPLAHSTGELLSAFQKTSAQFGKDFYTERNFVNISLKVKHLLNIKWINLL